MILPKIRWESLYEEKNFINNIQAKEHIGLLPVPKLGYATEYTSKSAS